MKSKPELRELARKIRQEQGLSINKIAIQLGVAKSTVLDWTRNIILTTEQKEQMRKNVVLGNQRKVHKNSDFYRSKREEAQLNGSILVKEQWFRDMCLLYWAEGSKRRNSLVFSNCDTDMLIYFIQLLKQMPNFCIDKISITVLSYNSCQDCLKKYWTDELNILDKNIKKITIVENKQTNKYNKYENGCLRIEYFDYIFVQMIYGGIQQIIGKQKSNFHW